MATDLEKLVLKVEAQTAAARAEMAKLSQKVSKHNRSMQRDFKRTSREMKAMQSVAGRLRGSFRTLLPAIGIAGFVAMTDRAFKSADAIAKVADSIGISTDALQEFRFAASQSGIASSTLDTGLQAFSKRLGELRNNTGSLNTVLSKMDKNFRLQIINAPSVAAALQMMLTKIASLDSQADKAALSAAAFSRTAGVQMTNLLRGGISALEKMRQQARDLGLVLEEDLLRQAEKTNDQFDILSRTLGTEFKRAVLQAGPALYELASALIQTALAFVKASVEALKFLGIIGRTPAEVAVRGVNKEIAHLKTNLKRAEGDAKRFTRRLVVSPNVVRNIVRIGKNAEKIARIKGDLSIARRERSIIQKNKPTNRSSFGAPTQNDMEMMNAQVRALSFKPGGGGKGGRGKGGGRGANQADEIKKVIERIRERARSIEEETQKLSMSEEKWNAHKVLQEAIHALKEKGIAIDEKTRAALEAEAKHVEDLTVKLQKMKEAKEAAAQATQQMQQLGQTIAQGFEDGVIAVLNDTGDAMENLANIAKSVADQIIRQFLRLAVINPILNALGLGGGANGAGLPSIFKMLKFAEGGRPPVGVPSVVGEQGKELFVPDTAGTIIPNKALRGMRGGGGGITILADMKGASVDAVHRLERLVQQLDATLEPRAIAANMAARTAGGSYAKVFGGLG